MAVGPRSIAEARAIVAAHTRPLGDEEVPVGEALGRILAEDVSAERDAPPFDNSAMDGFALRAGPSPRTLAVIGEARAGSPFPGTVGDGEAVRISTGAVLPAGADAVLRLEDADERDGRVACLTDVASGANVRRAGEDVASGATVLAAGTRLGPAELALAVIAGRALIACGRRPRVAVIATGDELRDPGSPLAPGEIHDSNGVLLAALAGAAGAQVVATARVGDDRDATEAAIAGGLAGADVVLLSGGVSVGPHDHVKPALASLGVEERFWRVALRPGGPTWFGTGAAGRLVFGLPGNPVSAGVTFVLFARPALTALQGGAFEEHRQRALLGEPVRRSPIREEAVRVTLSQDGQELVATPTGAQGSHRMSSLAGADALALVPAGDGELAAGSIVELVELRGT